MKTKLVLVIFFILLGAHGATLGLSDDEAYYWVLAQKPALAYAFHPPAVAWLIAGFQFIFGGAFGTASSGVVRLPAVLASTLVLGLAMHWFDQIEGQPDRSLIDQNRLNKKNLKRILVLLSFFGFFSLSWMMVPDSPLFLGWTLLFVTTWKICFGQEKATERISLILGLILGAALTLLSKYSGVLGIFSAFVSILLWAPRREKKTSIAALFVGSALAAIPILIWNSRHEWASILYQIRDRHVGDGFSWVRYLRFWLLETALAGPLVVGYFFWFIKKGFSQSWRGLDRKTSVIPYVLVWTIPAAAVFCIQPLGAHFLPHWAFIVWWPVCMGLSWASPQIDRRLLRIQLGWGLPLGAVVLLACQIPLGTWLGQSWHPGEFDVRMDVSNDLYGWSELREFMQDQWGDSIFQLPVVGSRYQIGGQASFSLDQKSAVTFIPRDAKEQDEWPDLKISDGQGPEWPKLTQPVLYLTDNRYQLPPQFKEAVCAQKGKFEKKRAGQVVKWIEIWQCKPND